MTCIVGLIDKDNIWMGGDSATSDMNTYESYSQQGPKVFCKGSFLFGSAGSFRQAQVLRYSFNVPEQPKDCNTDTFMRTIFVDKLRNAFKQAGTSTVSNSEEQTNVSILVGYNKRLFEILYDYQVGENVLPFNARGSGRQIARGSLFSTSKLSPRKRILLALRASECFSAGIRAPYKIVCMNKNNKIKTEIVEK